MIKNFSISNFKVNIFKLFYIKLNITKKREKHKDREKKRMCVRKKQYE